MRSILVALACLAVCAAPASAQTTTPAPAAAPLDPATQTPERLAAARDLLSAALVESGALSSSLQVAFANLAPQMRANVQNAPIYTSATAAHKDALDAYFAHVPELVSAEMNTRLPSIVASGAPGTAALYTEAEMRATTAFLRTPAGRSFFAKSAMNGAAESSGGGAAAAFTDDERQAIAAFNASPAGLAFDAHAHEFSAVVLSVLQAGFADITPHLRAKFARDICAILETDCPPTMRAAGQSAN